MLSRLSHWWNRIWFEPVSPYPLAAFRIAFGCYLLGFFLEYLPYVEVAFSNEGVYSPYRIGDIAPSPSVAWMIYGGLLLSILAFTAGFYTRVATVLTFLGFEYHYYLNFAVRNATFDRINEIVLFVMCFTCAGEAWSLDARRRQSVADIPAWQIRLLQFQLAALYFGTGVWKLFNPAWHSPDIMRYSVGAAWSTPLAFELLRPGWPDWVFSALAWSVIVFELLAGFTLYFKKTRTPTMVIGTLFHLFNAVVLLIPAFLNCVTMYALFIDFKPRQASGESVEIPNQAGA
jgi:hypothetical protein